MKNILLLVTSCLLFTTVHAYDQESSLAHFYAKLLGGANFLHNATTDGNKSTFKAGYIIDAMFGYCWSCGLRLEAEYAFRRNAIKKIDFYVEGYSTCGYFQSSSAMVNLLWGLPVYSRRCPFWDIRPFMGIGLGYDFQQLSSSNSRFIFYQKWNSLAWQATAGLTYPITGNADMTLEYKFHQGGCHFYSQSVGIGLVYTFGF